MTARKYWEAEMARHNGSVMLSDPVAAIEAAILEERLRIAAQVRDCLAPPEGEAIAEMIRGSGGVLCARFDPRGEEREACAKIADKDFGKDVYMGGYSVQDIQKWAADRIAKVIRKRGQS